MDGWNDMDLSHKLKVTNDVISSGDFQSASHLCQLLIRSHPENADVWEMSAMLLYENGKSEEALFCFEECEKLQPNDGHSKYFVMAQIVGGKQAEVYYVKGIDILEKQQLQQPEDVVISEAKISKTLSTAYAALAELYMTDLCDEEDAENVCRDYVAKALKADPFNPEALMSSVFLSVVTNKKEEARESLLLALKPWLYKVEELSEEEVLYENLEELTGLTLESRMNCVRMALRLDENEIARKIIRRMRYEDEDNLELQFLTVMTLKPEFQLTDNDSADPSVKEWHKHSREILSRARLAGCIEIENSISEMLESVPLQIGSDDSMSGESDCDSGGVT